MPHLPHDRLARASRMVGLMLLTLGVPTISTAEAKAVAKPGSACTAAQIGQVLDTPKGQLVCLRTGKKVTWRLARSSSSTVPPTTASVSRPGTVLFKDDFSGFGGKWPSVQSIAGSAGYRDEKFRIVVTQPASVVGVRAPFDQESNIVLEVDASIISPSGQIALGCHDSGPLDAPNRYLAAVDRTDRWSIVEIRSGAPRVLASGEMALGTIHAGDLANRFVISCTGSAGGTGRVSVGLNGAFVGSAIVTNMLAPGAVSLWATSLATPTINGTTSVDTIWNDVVVRRAG